MTETLTIDKLIEKIENEAETTKVAKDRYFPLMNVGEIVRQGDIYIHKVEDKHPHGDERSDRQLAQGFSQGSRHIAESPCRVYEGTTPAKSSVGQVFLGPFIQSDCEFTISHPQHANVTLGAGSYQVTHQLDIKTLKRVID
jgi:hypothetical protein